MSPQPSSRTDQNFRPGGNSQDKCFIERRQTFNEAQPRVRAEAILRWWPPHVGHPDLLLSILKIFRWQGHPGGTEQHAIF
jgi:hypothetical protein